MRTCRQEDVDEACVAASQYRYYSLQRGGARLQKEVKVKLVSFKESETKSVVTSPHPRGSTLALENVALGRVVLLDDVDLLKQTSGTIGENQYIRREDDQQQVKAFVVERRSTHWGRGREWMKWVVVVWKQ